MKQLNRILLTVLLLASFFYFGCASTTGGIACHSPANYIKEVYSSGNNVIEYSLDSDIQYKTMNLVFFAKRGKTLRNNTSVKLDKSTGSISIPDDVFVPPSQRWFNFYVTNQNGCSMWGLVNEIPILKKGNIIGIDEPTPGEGHAFILK